MNLVRLPNLLMIVITQVLVKYSFFAPFKVETSLGHFDFALLVLAMVCLAAAGNIINDIYDLRADLINKPHKVVVEKKISEKAAFNAFMILNILGVGLGFYLSNLVGKPAFTALFIMPSAFLYIYATQLKSSVLVGNIVISIMVAMVIVMVGIFDLVPAITPENRSTQKVIFMILVDYGIFAFLINLLREMIKDQEDIQGDYNAGYNTLPILLGRERAKLVIFTTAFIPLGALIYYLYHYLFMSRPAMLYMLGLVVAPLLYFLIKLVFAKNKQHYKHLSSVLKFILVTGIFSIGLYRFVLL